MRHNTLHHMFKILRHKEQMILSSSKYEKTYLQGFLEGVLKAFQVSNPLAVFTQSLDGCISSSKRLTKREREEMIEFSQVLHVHLELWSFSPYILTFSI